MNIYGFGIVDKNGSPWWDEACVCNDKWPMDEQVESLNEYEASDPRAPYRVVRLIWEEIA